MSAEMEALDLALKRIWFEKEKRQRVYTWSWNNVGPIELRDDVVLSEYGKTNLDSMFDFFFTGMLPDYLYHAKTPEIVIPLLTLLLNVVKEVKSISLQDTVSLRRSPLKKFISLGFRLDKFVKISFKQFHGEVHDAMKIIQYLELLEEFTFETVRNPEAFSLMPLSAAKSSFRLHLEIRVSGFTYYMHQLARYCMRKEISEKLVVHFKAAYGVLNACEKQITRALLTSMASYGIKPLKSRLWWSYESTKISFYESFSACSIIPSFGNQHRIRYT